MARLAWNAPSERFFEAGLDRGVFYPKSSPPPILDGMNEAINPRAVQDAGLTNWTANGGNGSSYTTQAVASGGWNDMPYRTITWTVAPTSENYLQRIYTTQTISVTPGEIVSVGLRGFRNSNKATQLIISYFLNGVYVNNVTSAYVGQTPNVWALIKKEGIVIPVGVNQIRVDFYAGLYNNVAAGDVMSATAFQFSRTATLPDYYDGDSYGDLGSLYSAEWSGAVNNSISKRYVNQQTAVPWNGLVSVEESGSEDSTSYYIDGRPYLHFPPPKDFAASLTAYTYPDEFAEVMGVEEIEGANGLFIDSQIGDTFDLSYRTLVGNGVDGLNHGYKIHLVYNATVTAPASNYESLGSDINPNQFQWEIKAVPEEIEGYRPSAHFIIDTRHMSSDILAKLEELLYGDTDTIAMMPEPIDVIELLTYGGAIVIVDNGDGTWSAMGSRHDIYLLDEDTFQIDNVEMVDYGDGFFGVTTTPA